METKDYIVMFNEHNEEYYTVLKRTGEVSGKSFKYAFSAILFAEELILELAE
jgi:hypothetical protein